MQSFTSPRVGTLTYTRIGHGEPVICIPGGPLLPADYLEDLGGLSQHAELILFNLPGALPGVVTDAAALRCDLIVQDLEALRQYLALDRVTLLGHSAGANIVARYAERYGEHVKRLVLVAPSTRAVGLNISDADRSAVARLRAGESWYAEAAAALARIQADEATDTDWNAIAPFTYGRWNDGVAQYEAAMNTARNPRAAAAFGADGAFDPPTTREALAELRAPVTVIAGGVDVGLPLPVMQQLVDLFPHATLRVQDGAGHFPWVDDPHAFVESARTALLSR
ncbi:MULTISPECIES: alpha/beta fold hydrolase [unclassified Curtobacterium]|uniref:alpha/beta fold hydrolase n=1 Tax=unclassified Curtobacterium TaxID=257496 RepID=UPI002042680B|nr:MULTISPECIES: alpha/beta hydrolase [unclassified Curtobacterium]MCM3522596.1 alpha/beta hydrolase [Curtobacterium sp. P97]MDT0210056.1 alpha/beta hydrolase [Curtobacterium sp. BRD11]